MIIQGTNIPLKVTIDENVDSYQDFVASLWIQGKETKSWRKTKGEIIADGTTAILPLDEDETKEFKKGTAKLLVKGLNFYGETVFWEEEEVTIVARDDRIEDLID